MSDSNGYRRTKAQVLEENEQLRLRLEEAEQTLEAIRHGEVDALVVVGPPGEQIYTLTGAEHVYRVIVETMNEAALTVDPDGTILFCNQRFCDLLKAPIQEVMGRKVTAFAARPQQLPLKVLLKDAQAGPVQRRLTLRATDGTTVPVQLAASLLQTGDSTSICLVASDLTELEASANSIRVLREHQQALRESEERYRTLFESSRDGIIFTDMEGQVLHTNPYYQEMLGYTPKELRALTYQRLTPPRWHEREAAIVRDQVLTRGYSDEYEKEYIRKDGSVFPVSIRVWLIRDEKGRPQGMWGIVRDITERKRAEEALRESEERLRLAQQAGRVGVFDRDLQNNTVVWTPELEELFGIPGGGFEGKYEDWAKRVYPEDLARMVSFLQEWIQSDRTEETWEYRFIRDDGQVRWMEGRGRILRDPNGEPLRMIGTNMDITERKQAEDALRELNATLETRVAQRTAQLEHRARQLQKLALELSQAEDRERKHLAEILHDDLQQQLAAAKFHLGMLRNRVKYDPAQRSIAGQVDHMLAEAIEKSRSLSHELSPAILYHGDLGEALEWLGGQMQTKYGLTVHVDADGEVDVQSDALKVFLFRAAQELLFNVVKHARVNAARVRVRCMGHCLCLCVSDRGRGFNPQDLKATAGFGLLSIRERVELLGGRMRIKAATGKGSTFFLAVPDGELSGMDLEQRLNGEEADGRAARNTSTPEPSRPRLRVLLADDHEIVREGLAVLLNDHPDIEIVGQAANGREAVDLAYQLHPDVVVMDVAMPLMGGDEATRQIKLHMPNVRVIGLSMYEEDSMAEKMRRAGAEAYLLKTGPAEELLAAIRGAAVLSK